jgi:hypothetical protein
VSTTFTVTLRAAPGVDDACAIRSLRLLLKRAPPLRPARDQRTKAGEKIDRMTSSARIWSSK